MRISVIIPSYRRAEALSACLDSLAAQSRTPDEVVVVHRKSDAETAGLVASRGDLPIVPVEVGEISKITLLENAGLERATGEIAAFTDDDAVVPPGWLAGIEGHFAADEAVGAVGGPVFPVEEGKVLRQSAAGEVMRVSWYGRVVDGKERLPADGALPVDHLPGANMAFRRELLGAFAEGLRGYSYRFEMERCLALRRAGWKVICDPALAVEHHSRPRVGSGTGFGERVAMHCNNTAVLLWHLSPLGKAVFLPYTFVWGDGGCPGVLRIVGGGVVRLRPVRALVGAAAAVAGKTAGVLLGILSSPPSRPAPSPGSAGGKNQ